MKRKNVLARLSAPPISSFIDYTSEGGGSKMLKSSGIDRVCDALANGYDTKDLGALLGVSPTAILSALRKLGQEDSIEVSKAMIQGNEGIIEELTVMIKEELCSQYERMPSETKEEADDILKQGQKAMLSEKRIKNLEAMIKVYERKITRMENRLSNDTSKGDSLTIEHNIIVSDTFVNILPK